MIGEYRPKFLNWPKKFKVWIEAMRARISRSQEAGDYSRHAEDHETSKLVHSKVCFVLSIEAAKISSRISRPLKQAANSANESC